jgi:hypothetical protein
VKNEEPETKGITSLDCAAGVCCLSLRSPETQVSRDHSNGVKNDEGSVLQFRPEIYLHIVRAQYP